MKVYVQYYKKLAEHLLSLICPCYHLVLEVYKRLDELPELCELPANHLRYTVPQSSAHVLHNHVFLEYNAMF